VIYGEYRKKEKIFFLIWAQKLLVTCKTMIFVKSPFFNLNRIFLLLLGIWPYQKSKIIYVQRLFSLGIFISFAICQVFSTIIYNFLLKYYSFICITFYTYYLLHYIYTLYYIIHYIHYLLHVFGKHWEIGYLISCTIFPFSYFYCKGYLYLAITTFHKKM